MRTPLAPERPPLPKPERINRNALTIVAVIMGTLVIATVVFIQPNRPAVDEQRAQPAVPPVLPQGTYLDQPVRRAAPTGAPPAAALDSLVGARAVAGAAASRARPGAASVAQAPADPLLAPYALAQPLATPVTADRRLEAFEAALVAPVFASERRSATGAEPSIGSDWELGAARATATSSSAQGQRSEPLGGTPPSNVPVSLTSGGRLDDRISRMTGATRSGVMRTAVDPAPGPFAIQAGTLIPAVLLTGIDSDLPGEVLAQVARDVYDSRSMRALLIPKGSKLIGEYEDRVGIGQDRLLVAWTRIVFPDGRSVTLSGLETKDRAGAAGMRDQVDHHTSRVFGTATLLSLIGAGVQLSQPQGGAGLFGAYPSLQQVAAAAVGQELAQVATQMLQRNLDIRPTIRIRQGMPFNVFFNADLTFDAPYLAQR